jgi:hypothetical protein
MAKLKLGQRKGITGVKTKADDKAPNIKTPNTTNGQRTSDAFKPASKIMTEMMLPPPRKQMVHPLPKKWDANVAPATNATTVKKGF